MEWISDPTAWTGLVALTFLQLILGVDNLVFIAILAQRLKPQQRSRAAKLGLLMALGLRVAMLLGLSWMASLRQPLFSVLGQSFSGRDLIMMGGGAFLLWKATHEIHTRLEGRHLGNRATFQAKFWMVVTQIFVLDSVFSIDAVITALGMTDFVSIMVISMAAAVLIMIALARPLTSFMQKHPTVVMLCLGFLLMVGFSLIAEGFGMRIPHGYLYAAIGFSLLVEFFNQFAQTKLKRRVKQVVNVRQKTADAILKLMGAKPVEGIEEVQEANAVLQQAAETGVLSAGEKEILRGVLHLSTRQVRTVMTPRREIEYIDQRAPAQEIYEGIVAAERSRLVVVDGALDRVTGVLRKDMFLADWLKGDQRLGIEKLMEEPLFVKESTTVMGLLEFLKKYPAGLAIVTGDDGEVEGVVTHIDLLEAIAGEFPSQEEPYAPPPIREAGDGTFIADGAASIYDVCNKLGLDLPEGDHFTTIGGLVLHNIGGRLPQKGDTASWQGWRFEVRRMDGRRISLLRITKIPEDGA